jgi:Leucine-rich repeat (LRR) protein
MYKGFVSITQLSLALLGSVFADSVSIYYSSNKETSEREFNRYVKQINDEKITTIELSGQRNTGVDTAVYLVDIMKACETVTNLKFKKTYFNKDTFNEFIKQLKLANIVSLEFKDCGIKSDMAENIVAFVNTSKKLESLSLEENYITTLPAVVPNETLKTLNISRNWFKDAEGVADFIANCKGLSELNVSANSFTEPTIQAIANVVLSHPNIQVFDFSSVRMGYYPKSGKGLNDVAEMLKVNKNLRTLDLSGNSLASADAEYIQSFSDALVDCELNELVLRNSGMSLTELKDGIANNDSITSLNLSETYFNVQDWVAFAKEIIQKNKTITHYNLSQTEMEDSKIVNYVFSWMRDNTIIKTLDLSRNGFNLDNNAAIDDLFSMKNLEYLSLASNNLMDTVPTLLGKLKNNKSIVYLDLSKSVRQGWDGLEHKANNAVMAIGELLESNTTLKEIGYYNNDLTNWGFDELKRLQEKYPNVKIYF